MISPSFDASPRTAEEVREHNAALDEVLRELAAAVPAEALGRHPGGDEHTVAQVLAHLGEQPRFVAEDLAAWLEGAEQVGRTQADPAPLATAADAEGADVAVLRAGLDESLGALADVLDRLEDPHLDARTSNRKYGEEPLVAYLDRYVLTHKAGHAEQLRHVLEQARATPRT